MTTSSLIIRLDAPHVSYKILLFLQRSEIEARDRLIMQPVMTAPAENLETSVMYSTRIRTLAFDSPRPSPGTICCIQGHYFNLPCLRSWQRWQLIIVCLLCGSFLLDLFHSRSWSWCSFSRFQMSKPNIVDEKGGFWWKCLRFSSDLRVQYRTDLDPVVSKCVRSSYRRMDLWSAPAKITKYPTEVTAAL